MKVLITGASGGIGSAISEIYFENNYVKGSISLSKGGAIDDFQFKEYNKTLGSEEKISLLEKIESIARKLNPHIIKVSASLASQFEVILIKTFHGELVEDVRPLVRLSVSVIIEKNQRREQGSAGGGGGKSRHSRNTQTMQKRFQEKQKVRHKLE